MPESLTLARSYRLVDSPFKVDFPPKNWNSMLAGLIAIAGLSVFLDAPDCRRESRNFSV